MYAANHYVRVAGKRYVAGEILPEDLPQEKIAGLLRSGAITPVGGVPAIKPAAEPAAEPETDGTPAADETPEDAAIAADETPEEEIDAEAEPEEIDAADGIVSAPTKSTAKPAAKRKGGRK